MVVEEISGWFTTMGLYIPETATPAQTGFLVNLRRTNTYLLSNPKRWGENMLNFSKVNDFIIATRAPFLKVYRLSLDEETDEALSKKLKKKCQDQYVDVPDKISSELKSKTLMVTPKNQGSGSGSANHTVKNPTQM